MKSLRSQSSFNRPPARHSLANLSIIHSDMSSPLRSSHFLPAVFYKYIIGLVICLVEIISPVAILRAVVAVIVSAFNACFGLRSLTHIIKKALKGVAPAVAYFNTSTAIYRIFGIVRVVASSNYPLPSHMLRSPAHAVRSVMVVQFFRNYAATRFRASIVQPTSRRYGFLATLADAVPSGVSAFRVWCARDDSKPAKRMTTKVDEVVCFSHRSILSCPR